jgi:hypothetical protein
MADAAGGEQNAERSGGRASRTISNLIREPVSCNDETNLCISSSDMDGSVYDGVSYEVISAGRQLLNSDDFPTQSRAVMSPETAMISCKSCCERINLARLSRLVPLILNCKGS